MTGIVGRAIYLFNNVVTKPLSNTFQCVILPCDNLPAMVFTDS